MDPGLTGRSNGSVPDRVPACQTTFGKAAFMRGRGRSTIAGRLTGRRLLAGAWLLVALGPVVGGRAFAEPVDYARTVKPLLRQRCYGCHGAVKQKAGLRLDTGA